MSPSFAVKTDVFEGPLELLLDLIEKRKLLINDISLAAVTDDYIAHVRNLQENHLTETAHFVLIAATLLLIKSKSLLPVLELTDEESHTVADLELRLKLYQIYRNQSVLLRDIFDEDPLFERTYIPDTTPLFTTDHYTTPQVLHTSVLEVIKRFPKPVFRPQVAVRKVMSLEDMIKTVEERITHQYQLSFNDFVTSHDRTHVIIGFLAVLELVKQGTILVQQEIHFHDITIERGGGDIDTPNYS